MKAHNWHSYCWTDADGTVIVNVIHHWTQMIQFKVRKKSVHLPIGVRNVSHVDIGHGSKSDQKGMNRIFIKLGLPWYYARNNKDPRILKLPDDVNQLPMYLRNKEVRIKHFGYCA